MFCTKCGKQIGEVEELCASCGAKILRPNDEKKENIVLAVFAVILSIIIPYKFFEILYCNLVVLL